MTHKYATTEEVRAVIQQLIRESVALNGDCAECLSPTPFATSKQNPGGSSWAVAVLPAAIPGCDRVIFEIVLEVMSEYEIRE